MIIPDVNLLIYAYDTTSPFHKDTKDWFEDLLSSEEPVGFTWMVLSGFIRLVTQRTVFKTTLDNIQALDIVESWLQVDCSTIVEPSTDFFSIFKECLLDIGIGGGLVPDAYLAALAIENKATLCSSDNDFNRFTKLKWANPLK